IAGGAVDPEADWGACARAYAGGVGIAFLDGFLRAPALEALRAFCLSSTIWSTYRYAKGYFGAFVEQGFACPLLAQIATELAERLPGIFAAYPVPKIWAFKSGERPDGIGIHADLAAVNVNFWITPDSANL